MATTLIIIFVAAMALGPLMWFRSTPAQRRLVQLRSHAAERGLRVRLISGKELELPGLDSGDTVAAYCLVASPSDKAEGKAPLEARSWRLIKERISHEAHFSGYWNWQRKRPAEPEWHPVLRQVLAELPADTIALDYDRGTLCIYWREKGGPAEVDRLMGILQQILQHAGIRPSRSDGAGFA